MNNIMEYKGYVGSVEFSEPDGLFFGKVIKAASTCASRTVTLTEEPPSMPSRTSKA